MNALNIRRATAADSALLLGFINELAEFEKAPEEVLATEATIRESLFGENSVSYALICESEGKAVGSAIYFFNYSTWLAKNGLYLEDLYVTPSARGQGVGKALLKHLAGIALDKNCGRFEWSVLDWNTPAIEFYDSLGAEPQGEWLGYRMSGQALQNLARG